MTRQHPVLGLTFTTHVLDDPCLRGKEHNGICWRGPIHPSEIELLAIERSYNEVYERFEGEADNLLAYLD